jgi:hypothetical protein
MNYTNKIYHLPAGYADPHNGDHTGLAGFLTAKGML